ncbi:MAG: hypothetical protein ACXWC8_02710, partial [Limisphaerales bacterium]
MLVVLHLFTIAGVIGITFLLFSALGEQRTNLLYTKEEKEEWETTVGARLGLWFTRTNIFGTITSLATVYLFFLGSSKLFGGWIVLCSATIFVGAFVTNRFTERICNSEHVQKLLSAPDQIGGVIASVFWREDKQSRVTANLIKQISLFTIGAVIWLEFAVFADISGALLQIDSVLFRAGLLFVCAFSIIFFTMRYGLRGFVFADLFHAPLIIFSSLILFVGCLLLMKKLNVTVQLDYVVPILSKWQILLFCCHVVILNTFFNLITEPHWLRIWIFGKKETGQQVWSILGTAVLWLLLMAVGFFASHITGEIGEKAVGGLLTRLKDLSLVFTVAFWAGGVAALFSTADAQIYSFILVRQFNSTTGKLNQKEMHTLNPLKSALISSFVFAVVFGIIRALNLPMEKVIFSVMPLCLNILPAFIAAFRGLPQNPVYIIVALVLYSLCAVVGLL